MLRAMLDSNVCIRAMRSGGEGVRTWLADHAEQLCLSTIVLHELYGGARMSARPDHHSELVDDLATLLAIFDFDQSAARHAAGIRADLKRRGALIGSNDMLIAGHARSLDLTLVSSDLTDFSRVGGLRCADWHELKDMQ